MVLPLFLGVAIKNRAEMNVHEQTSLGTVIRVLCRAWTVTLLICRTVKKHLAWECSTREPLEASGASNPWNHTRSYPCLPLRVWTALGEGP